MMKVQLIRERRVPNCVPESTSIPMTESLPFYYHDGMSRVHRVRSGRLYFWSGNYTHSCVSLWCGQSGHFNVRHRPNARFLEEPPLGTPVCGICEGKARGSGQLGSRSICGRIVIFTPRV